MDGLVGTEGSDIYLGLADVSTGTEGEMNVFSGSFIPIGREPAAGICVLDEGISRQHGCFMRVRSHWLYRDLGSLNGSYINGKQLGINTYYLVRDGDILQLADICLRIKESDQEGPLNDRFKKSRSKGVIIVLVDDDLVGEFYTDQDGTVVTIGGEESELQVDNPSLLPSLVIEACEGEVFAYGLNSDVPIKRFGSVISEKIKLTNRNVLTVDSYTIIYEAAHSISESKNFNQTHFDWLSDKLKRKSPVKLVELRRQVAKEADVIGKGIVPVDTEIVEDITAATSIVKTSKSIALLTSTVASTTLTRNINSISPVKGNSGKHEKEAMIFMGQITDTMSVVSGILGCFIIVVCVWFMFLLEQGNDLRVILGM
jgi:hypothetical protein